MSKKCCVGNDPTRLNKVGGQAVIEGVMMKAGKRTVTTCRKEDKSIVVYDQEFVSVRKKHKILNLPILRGVVNFIEMMILSMKTLNASAEALGLEEETASLKSGARSTSESTPPTSLWRSRSCSALVFRSSCSCSCPPGRLTASTGCGRTSSTWKLSPPPSSRCLRVS